MFDDIMFMLQFTNFRPRFVFGALRASIATATLIDSHHEAFHGFPCAISMPEASLDEFHVTFASIYT